MNTRKLKTILFTALLLVLSGLVGCGQKNDSEENLCHIVLEDGEGYHVTEPARTVEAGSNVNFTVTLDNSWQFLGTDYHGKADIIKDNDGKTVELVLYKVKYSESVCIQAEKGKYEITYDANGGKTLSDKTDKVKKYYRGSENQYFDWNRPFLQRWLYTAWLEYPCRWNRRGCGPWKQNCMEKGARVVCTVGSMVSRGELCL